MLGPAQVAHTAKDKGVANVTAGGHGVSRADLCLCQYIFICMTLLIFVNFFCLFLVEWQAHQLTS